MTITALPPASLGGLTGMWRFAVVSRYPGSVAQGDLSDAASRTLSFDLLKAGTMSITVHGTSPQLQWLQELRSDLVAYRWSAKSGAFVPLMRACITKSEDQITAAGVHSVTFTATDYRGVLARMLLRDATTYTTLEQATIFSNLVALGNQPRGFTGALGLTSRCVNPDGSPLAATGITRTRSYTLGQQVAQALDDVSTDISGFDWSIDPDPATPGNAGVATLWYPNRGVVRSAWVAHYGSTVSALTRTVDTSTYLSYALTVGNAATVIGEAFGAGWNDPVNHPEGAWMTEQSQSSVTDATTCLQNSQGMIAQYGAVLPSYSLTLTPGRWSPDDCWLGDTVRLIVNSGRLSVDTSQRVVGVAVTVDDNGTESVTLTTGQPPPSANALMRQIDRRLSSLERR